MKDEAIFTFADIKSLNIILPTLLFVVVGSAFIFAGISGGNYPTACFGGLFFLMAGIFWFFLFGTKIKISDTGVEYSGIFKTVFMAWKDIKSVGGYIASRYSNQEINLQDINKFSFSGPRFLFLSTEEVDCVRWGQRISNKLIYFYYRPEMLALIEEHLKNQITLSSIS